MPSLNIKDYIIPILGFLLILMGVFSYLKVSSLETDLLVAQKATLQYQKESIRHSSALDLQTLQIETLKVERKKALKKLSEWKAKPTEVKYREVVKYLPSKEIIQRNSCDDIKAYFDSTNGLDLDRL